jgi:hypothetical protein
MCQVRTCTARCRCASRTRRSSCGGAGSHNSIPNRAGRQLPHLTYRYYYMERFACGHRRRMQRLNRTSHRNNNNNK